MVTPGAAGTPIHVVVSNEMGSLQGTVKLNGDPNTCWIYFNSYECRRTDGVYNAQ